MQHKERRVDVIYIRHESNGGIMRKDSLKTCLWPCLVGLAMYASCVALGLAQDKSANDIHRIDFRNFTYRPFCFWENDTKPEPIRVKNGSFNSKDKDGDVEFHVTSVVYGDLNNDGMDEAVVLTDCNTGGFSWFDEGFIYTMQNGKPVMLLRIQGGDRASGGIRAVRIENGLLLVERLGRQRDGPVHAEYIYTTSYRLSGKRLLQVGRPVRRSFRGERKARRIEFERGKTSATVTGTTSGADFYVLRADANQTMTVRITSKLDNARFEVVVDDATYAYRVTEWSEKLDGRGDYYIIVVSTGGAADYSLDVSVH
jgi:hypothetical protein